MSEMFLVDRRSGDEPRKAGEQEMATNLHEMGVPTKVILRVCRHADEATTKKHYIHATEPGVRRGMRKLEASTTREKNERR